MIIKSNNYEVMDTGSILAWGMEPTELILSEDFKVVIEVVKKENCELSIFTKCEDGKTIEITVTNPHLIANMRTVEPIKLGTFEWKKTFLSFGVNVCGTANGEYKSYKLDYTFYKEIKEEEV